MDLMIPNPSPEPVAPVTKFVKEVTFMPNLKLAIGVALLTLFSVLGLWGLHLSSELDRAKEVNVELNMKVSSLTGERDALRQATNRQNEMVQHTLDMAALASTNAQLAMDASNKVAAAWKGKYDKVIRGAPTSDKCQSLSNLLSSYIALRKQEAQP